jgi:hypothetical protein
MKNLTLNNGQTATFQHTDDWARPVYRLESGRLVCCVNLNGTHLHTMSRDGEPDSPLKAEFQPVTPPEVDRSGEYMMLDRLRGDCDGYLSENGDWRKGNPKRLWAGDAAEQIAEMRRRWQALPDDAKPEWLTLAKIDDYAQRMGV